MVSVDMITFKYSGIEPVAVKEHNTSAFKHSGIGTIGSKKLDEITFQYSGIEPIRFKELDEIKHAPIGLVAVKEYNRTKSKELDEMEYIPIKLVAVKEYNRIKKLIDKYGFKPRYRFWASKELDEICAPIKRIDTSVKEGPEYKKIKEDTLKNEDILNAMEMFHVKL